MAPKQRPVHEIRLGRIRAAIWTNQADGKNPWFNVTPTRLYKDGDRWKDTSTFRRDDLPIVSKVLDMAYAWIRAQEVPADSDEAADVDKDKVSNG